MSTETELLSVHPVIPVRDMNEALEFYEQKLGFTKVFDEASNPDDPINFAGVFRGGICLHPQTMSPDDDPTMPQIRFGVRNIEPLYEEHKSPGVIGPSGHLEAKSLGSKDFGIYDLNNAALVFYGDL